MAVATRDKVVDTLLIMLIPGKYFVPKISGKHVHVWSHPVSEDRLNGYSADIGGDFQIDLVDPWSLVVAPLD